MLSIVALATVASGAWIFLNVLSSSPGAHHPIPTNSLERSLYIPSSSGATLAAVLRLPDQKGGSRPVPAVLIVPAPWSNDHDGVDRPEALTNHPYRLIAESLAHAGIASLRYDQAGVGDTQVPDPKNLGGLGQLQADATAAFNALSAQRGIDPRRITVIGHGAGGMIAMGLAAQANGPAALVLVSTPGRPLREDLRLHLARHVLPSYGDAAPRLLAQYDQATDTLIQTGKVPASLDSALAPYFPPEHAELLRDLLRADPIALAGQVRSPTLVFVGHLDPLIPTEDGTALDSALSRTQHEVLVGEVTGHNLEVRPVLNGDVGHDAIMARTTVPDTDSAAIGQITAWIEARATR